MTKAFYTTTEAAKALGVSSARVRQLILKGDITAEKVGRDLLIPPEAVERAKQRKTTPGPDSQIVLASADVAKEVKPAKTKRRASKRSLAQEGMKKRRKRGGY